MPTDDDATPPVRSPETDPSAPRDRDLDPHPDHTPDAAVRVLAGECTTEFAGTRERTQRGHVAVVVKPDRTVLVHDADGYQPVAWLTRPDSLTVEVDGVPATDAGSLPADPEGFGLTARTDDQTLRVVSHRVAGVVRFPVSVAGVPVGDCPDCGGVLVRTGCAVACVGCGREHGLPSGTTVLDEACPDCGLPRLRVDRGERFEVCLDRGCDPLVEHVRECLDHRWNCPDCGSPLRVLARGRLLLGCDAYPDCDRAFSLPAGRLDGRCDCGLPAFRTASGRRCLDRECEQFD